MAQQFHLQEFIFRNISEISIYKIITVFTVVKNWKPYEWVTMKIG